MKKGIIILLVIIAIIVIIGFCYIYDSAQKTMGRKIQSPGTLSQQEKDYYNNKFNKFMGNKVSGEDVKELIDAIIGENQVSVGNPGLRANFIGLTVENITKYDDHYNEQLKAACDEARNNYKNENDDSDTVVKASQKMKHLRTKIDAKKEYTVTGEKEDGIYSWITITENE